jgi:hypothetical protein
MGNSQDMQKPDCRSRVADKAASYVILAPRRDWSCTEGSATRLSSTVYRSNRAISHVKIVLAKVAEISTGASVQSEKRFN